MIEHAFADIYKTSMQNPPKTLDGHLKNENGITNDYRGRAIYEFFQNAIDRAEKKIWIHLDKKAGTLTIANDGEPFSVEKRNNKPYSDLESLCSINTSSKNLNESIGNKGVGFKSCWEYTQRVTVSSIHQGEKWGFELKHPHKTEDIKVSFHDANTKTNLETWKNNPDYRQVFEHNNRVVPSFYFPEYITDACHYFEKFPEAITVICFHGLNGQKIIDLEEKIKEFASFEVFFVQQLDKLRNSCVEMELKIDDAIVCTLHTQPDPEDWLVVNRPFSGEQLKELQEMSDELNHKFDNPKIAIAFPLKEKAAEERKIRPNFYCYLPTEMISGFHIMVHGDFLLDVSRKRIDFDNNKYNDRLLEHAAELFVDTLLNESRLHRLEYFGKFLNPNSRDDKFAQKVWKKFIDSANLKSILRKVYTQDKIWFKDAYEYVFQAIEKWKPAHKYNEGYKSYYETIYRQTLSPFCDDSILIVPVLKGDYVTITDSLPSEQSNKKLFYRSSKEMTADNTIFSKLDNVTISGFDMLNREYLLQTVVNGFETREILRAINRGKLNSSIENEDILKFVIQLLENINPRNEKHLYFKNDSIEFQLGRIALPVKNGEWRPAVECCTGILPEISEKFSALNFYELNVPRCKAIIEHAGAADYNEVIKKLGVWCGSIPPVADLFKIKDEKYKQLVNSSIQHWHGLEISKKELESESWYYDEINAKFVKPSEVFLFNDRRRRGCIAQDDTKNIYKELWAFFGIDTIEDTNDAVKIVTQLKLMEKEDLVDEYHKTVYRQLMLRLSRLEADINDIPLLLNDGSYTREICWFVSQENKKYIYHFPEIQKRIINLDENTKLEFVNTIKNIRRFRPTYTIKPDICEDDTEIKKYFENNYLKGFFALAENLSSNQYEKEEAIRRWNNLRIYRAEDVWLEIVAEDIPVKEVYKGSHQEVLYEPSDRGSNKTVGKMAYDLKHNGEYDSIDLSKFGYAIAEAIFRNISFGDVLSNYILNKRNRNEVNFLQERGIGEAELKVAEKFILTSLINHDEMQKFLVALNHAGNLALDKNNWLNKETWEALGLNYNELQELVIKNLHANGQSAKFQALLELVNPYYSNMRFFRSEREKLELYYYAARNEELPEEELESIIEQKKHLLGYFDFQNNPSRCIEMLDIQEEQLNDRLEFAQKELKLIKIKKKYTDLNGNMSFTPEASDKGVVKTSVERKENQPIQVTQVSYKEREDQFKARHGRGMDLERLFVIDRAFLLTQYKQEEKFRSLISHIEELKNVDFTNKSIEDVLHVSKSAGDGLGYDVLEPVFENEVVVGVNKVEIKSSRTEYSIYISENERQKIRGFANDTQWKLYHFVGGKLFDRTQTIIAAVTEHETYYNGKQLLTAENWKVLFDA